jgi:alanine-glyoxylate transaminase/serine-glyoxylate transaminase/serine-pyruvate transaminase
MPGRHHLFVPGPTNIPDRVLRAMHRGSEDHRSRAFPWLVLPLLEEVATLFDTTAGRVALFPATGTGGWEAALTNTLAPGATVLLPCSGQFADLWASSAGHLGHRVERFDDLTWGAPPPPARIAEVLRADAERRISAVLIVHNETSTGVTADLPGIRQAMDEAGHPALLMVDGVSSIASLPYHHDAWGVDVALTGSQKGLMLPAGLAILALSPRALDAVQRVVTPRAYFDLRPMLAQSVEGYFPYTPSIPMLHGLRESLAMLFEEGMDRVWARHHRLATGVRAAATAWDLPLVARDAVCASDSVSALQVPDGIDARDIIASAYTHQDLALGSGLGRLAGKVFRIGHLGDLNEGMLLGALGLVELALADAGMRVEFGHGVAAAQRVWWGGE